MALNFQSLGFAFAAEDKGLLTYQKQVLSGFDRINAQVDRMNKAASVRPSGAGGGAGGGGGGGDDGGGGGPMAMPQPPDPSKQIGAWGKFGAVASKALSGIFGGTKRATKELYGMADVGHKLRAILGQLKLGNIIDSLNLSRLNELVERVKDLGTAGRNLTTSSEASLQASNKTAKATLANLGLSAEVSKRLAGQAAGLARGYGADIGTATQALFIMEQRRGAAAVLGAKSVKDLININEVYGIDLLATTQSLETQSKALHISDADLAKLVQTTFAFGKAQNDVGGAMNALAPLMDKYAGATDEFGNILEGSALADYVTQLQALKAGFTGTGFTGDQATKAVEGMSDAFLAGRKQYADLLVAGGEFPEFLKGMAISTGDINHAFDLMNKGPMDAFQGLSDIIAQVRERAGPEGVQKAIVQLRARLGDVFTPEMARVLGEADSSVLSLADSAKKATESLAEEAKKSRVSPLTLAQQMQNAEEDLEMSFRRIGMANTRTFVTDATKNFKTFADQAKAIAAGDGPLAAIVTKLSEAASQGAAAFLPDSLKGAAVLFGNLLTNMAPVVTMLGALGFRLGMLASPLAWIAGPLAIAAVVFGDLAMKTFDAKTGTYDLALAWDQFGDKVDKFIDQDLPGYWTRFVSGLKIVGTWIQNKLPDVLAKGFGKALQFTEWITKSLKESDWSLAKSTFFDKFIALFQEGGAGAALLTGLGNMLNVAIPKVATLIGDMLAAVPWASIGKNVAGFISTVWDAAFGESAKAVTEQSPIAVALGQMVKAAWAALTDLAGGFWDQLEEDFGTLGATSMVGAALLLATPLGSMVTSAFAMGTAKLVWSVLLAPVASAIGAAITAAAVTSPVALAFGKMLAIGAGGGALLAPAAAVILAAGVGVAIGLAITKWFDLHPSDWGARLYNWLHGSVKEEADAELNRGPQGRRESDLAKQAKEAAAKRKAAAKITTTSMEQSHAAVAGMSKELTGDAAVSSADEALWGQYDAEKALPTIPATPEPTILDEAKSLGSAGGLGRSKKSIALVRQEAEKLPQAFADAYTNVTPKTAKFFETYTKSFKDFTKGLNDIWLKGITSMLDAMNVMVLAVQADASTISADVQRMTQQLLAVQDLHDKTMNMSAAAEPVIPAAMQTNLDNLPETFKAVAMAVHDPAWYTHYKDLFSRKMDALIAVSGSKGATAPGPRGPSAAKLVADRNRDVLAKSIR